MTKAATPPVKTPDEVLADTKRDASKIRATAKAEADRVFNETMAAAYAAYADATRK